LTRTAWRGAGIGLALATLEILPRTGLLKPTASYPPLSNVLDRAVQLLATSDFWRVFGQTMISVVVGVAAAFVVGVILGLAVGTWRPVYRAAITTLDFLRGIPPVALIPVIVLLMPVGLGSQTLLAAYSSQWVVFFQVVYGRRSINPTLWDTARVMHLGRWERFRYVIWPSLLPSLATGARIGVSVSLALAITAGLVMGGPSLGQQLNILRGANDIPGSYALIFIIGLIGLALNSIVVGVERRVLNWHVSIRREGE
jgi:ABC-type nitrate/sulfonate/bicarbonate transport system permease component